MVKRVYTPEGGSQTVVSETSAEAFSYTLDGACTVQSLNRRSAKGTVVIVL